MFRAVKTDVKFPKQEEAILDFWKSNRIYEKSLEQREGGKPFVFFEGPPTANGLPHPGHCLTRAIKDLFPRYRTMRGYWCNRKAGWDTHGLPVEVEVCKELGIHSKEEIEQFGVEKFIAKCQQSVWRYMQEWERVTERLGFWIDLSQAYVTYQQSYVESVWWSLKNLFDRGLLYRGHKIVWWWAQGGTALSSGEVGQGYREVADPSVYVRFPILGSVNPSLANASLIVWTTTPWTLPSNQFAAVHRDIEYSVCQEETAEGEVAGERFVVAASLVEMLAEKIKRKLRVVSSVKGAELVGLRYQPPFDYYHQTRGSQVGSLKTGGESIREWRVVHADFVTVDSGTGIVHLAPAFGEVDYDVLVAERERFVDGSGPALICAVGPDGKFTEEAPDYQGVWVKDADKPITRALRERGKLWHQEQYVHDYPFCWRASEDPLIQYPRESWFIRTTAFRDAMLENNRQIGWLPEHIGSGRFGNFLESNVDWALSRERYWGTPLPVWVCESTGKKDAIASYDELCSKPGVQGLDVWLDAKAKNPELAEDLKVHKPYIDAVTYDSPFAKGARMHRVPEVIDCWYDSGAMPFAQWGYPHSGKELFAAQFPADFISEAIDQTRGWFYSQLAISTMLFGDKPGQTSVSSAGNGYPHPFKNCIVLGLMLAEWYESKDGKQRFLTEEDARAALGGDFVQKTGKMSKQLRNYRSPQEIFDRYGADALRWYLFANQAPWNSILYSERAIRDSIPEFILRLWNVFSFFTIYAEIDGFVGPADISGPLDQLGSDELSRSKTYRPVAQRSELDRWIMSELAATCRDVVDRMDRYDSYGACQSLHGLVDALSNWYVRRSRSRYWASDKSSQDKIDAYWTLYEALVVITKLIAPFTPFLAETLWQNLTGSLEGVRESVHLCDFPTGDFAPTDATLNARMALLREIASLGRSARMDSKLKVRQPLGRVEVTLANDTHAAWLTEHDDIVREELNVKEIHYTSGASPFVSYSVQPNFRRLGPRVGALLPKLKQSLGALSGSQLMEEMTRNGKILISIDGKEIELDGEDIQVRLSAKDGWAAAQGSSCVVALNTALTPSLIREGIVKDAIRLVQDLRKRRQCNFTDRIVLTVYCESQQILDALQEHRDFLTSETLASSLHLQLGSGDTTCELVELADEKVAIDLKIVSEA